jgi:hypothetical protein
MPARAALLVALAAALALAGCRKSIEAPAATGVCYAMAFPQNAPPKFNVVASGIRDMEHCAAELEGMRIRFLSLGGSQREVTGAYNGSFLFLDNTGVFTANNYDGVRYPFLVRTEDGHLVPPGAQQP